MAVTSSIGPGATNFLTACALAYVNRLPVLFLPGDVFANRLPDPVLQQTENFDEVDRYLIWTANYEDLVAEEFKTRAEAKQWIDENGEEEWLKNR